MNSTRKVLLLAVSTLAFCVARAHATDRLVPAQYATIQAAIDATAPGDSVIIADGTYTGAGNKNLDYGGKAITVRSASGDPTLCIIDCQNSGRGFRFQSNESPLAVVEGIWVKSGRAPISGNNAFGGGMLCQNGASPTVRNCRITGSGESGDQGRGGAVYCSSGASPRFEGCSMSGYAEGWLSGQGGALASDGAGTIWLKECDVKGTAYSLDGGSGGGGIYCESTTALILESCVVHDSKATTGGPDGYTPRGGGIYATGTPVTIVNSVVQNNLAAGGGDHAGATGGGAYLGSLSTLVNCVVRNNKADGRSYSGASGVAGGLYVGGNTKIINSTVINNSALAGSQVGVPGEDLARAGGIRGGIVINCVVYGNTVSNFNGPAEGPQVYNSTVRYSDVEGGAAGVGNIDANPQLLTSSYRVASTSPVIDAGSNGALPADTYDLDNDGDVGEPIPIDIDGLARFVDGPVADTGDGAAPIVDMGAAEFADCDSDSIDDGAEIAAGTADDCDGNSVPDNCQTDTNNDGLIDACDCNDNGIDDGDEIAAGSSSDCDDNNVPDECQPDANTDGLIDACDCNDNAILDYVDLAVGTSSDCNGNVIPDECDLASGFSLDCNLNDTPDECEAECNANGSPDDCDIASGTSLDCNNNDIPDECDFDCNDNGVPDDCDIASGTSFDCDSNGTPNECDPDCDANGESDICELIIGGVDCNTDGVIDACQLGDRASIILDGDADYVLVGPSLPTASTFTVEAWIRSENVNDKQVIVSRRPSAQNGGFAFFIENGQIVFTALTILRYDTASVLSSGQWQHVTVSFNNSTSQAKFYLNGALVGDVAGAGGVVSVNGDTYIGAHPPNAEFGFLGAIGEVFIWNKVRSDAQVASDYVTQLTGAENGVLGYWNLNEGSGTIAADVAHGYDGTLQGDTSWTLADTDGNGVLDTCQSVVPDCNLNDVTDDLEIAQGSSADCNTNGVPDECDISNGSEPDINNDGIPDSCQPNVMDCNLNGIADSADIASGTSIDCNTNGIPDACEVGGDESALTDTNQWTAFSPNDNGVGSDLVGYEGAVFDGRYLYFSPFQDDAGFHGRVLRFDTLGNLTNPADWKAYDPGDHGVGADPDGYHVGVFDGRFVYFSPFHNGTMFSSEVLRFDTTLPFEQATSWSTYDPFAAGVSSQAGGYNGAVFDGRFVYFVPFANANGPHGEVLRYDTAKAFSSINAWSAYDPGGAGVGNAIEGYWQAIFEGGFVYFVPYSNDLGRHGEVLRLDTTQPFAAPSSWSAYDPGAAGVGVDPDGYRGGVSDGRYIYFAPEKNGASSHGEVLRYDTFGSFSAPTSWSTFDASGVCSDCTGYFGAAFDGQFVYFAPFIDSTTWHGKVLRYNTVAAFDNPDAWQSFDIQTSDVGAHGAGFGGVTRAGGSLYFAPFQDDSGKHGEVVRLTVSANTDCNANHIPDECDISAHDCNTNGVVDECETIPADCNTNGVLDLCDLFSGSSLDQDVDGVPDECQLGPDCNSNGVDDSIDISGEFSPDCNTNGVPDECDMGIPADHDVDGDVDDDDYAAFEDCLFGPAADLQLMSPCGASCLQWFDANGDNRIDLYDFGYMQEQMAGP